MTNASSIQTENWNPEIEKALLTRVNKNACPGSECFFRNDKRDRYQNSCRGKWNTPRWKENLFDFFQRVIYRLQRELRKKVVGDYRET